jgi:hypothetical protein
MSWLSYLVFTIVVLLAKVEVGRVIVACLLFLVNLAYSSLFFSIMQFICCAQPDTHHQSKSEGKRKYFNFSLANVRTEEKLSESLKHSARCRYVVLWISNYSTGEFFKNKIEQSLIRYFLDFLLGFKNVGFHHTISNNFGSVSEIYHTHAYVHLPSLPYYMLV